MINLFDCAITLMVEFVNLLPVGIVVILVLNLISDLLLGR